jgi:hypothetical protein
MRSSNSKKGNNFKYIKEVFLSKPKIFSIAPKPEKYGKYFS